MANYKPVIPRADQLFNALQNTLLARALANHVAWGIPLSEINALQVFQADWDAAWAIAKNKASRTPVQVTAKNMAREIYEAKLRVFIQRWIVYNELMNDADRISVQVEPRVKNRRHVPKPDSTPFVLTKPEMVHRVTVFFRQSADAEGAANRGKPYGIKFCELAYSIGTKPSRPEECPHRLSCTKSPETLQFTEAQQGQMVYFYARWANSRGKGGVWTDMKKFMIP